MGGLPDLIGSAGLDSSEILRVFQEGGKYILPLHEFTKYAILHNNFYYDNGNSLAMNMFDIKINNHENEHFLDCLLISYIASKSNDEGFIHYSSLVAELQNYSFTEDQIKSSLVNCTNKKLLEKENRLTFIEDSSTNVEQLKYRATSIGLYHVKRWIGEFAYIDAMLFDTPILDESVKENIRKHVHSTNMYDRYTRAVEFKEYLVRCWNNMPSKPPYFDFVSVLDSQKFTFERVHSYIKRKYPETII